MSGIGSLWFNDSLTFLIISLSRFRLKCKCGDVDENVCWKLRTAYFLFGISFSTAFIMLSWSLYHVVSSDSEVSVVRGVL